MRAYNSYKIHTLHRVAPGCRTLCGSGEQAGARCRGAPDFVCRRSAGAAAVRTLNSEQIQIMSTLIDERYEVEWIVDNLPVVSEQRSGAALLLHMHVQVIEGQAENEEGVKFKVKSPFFPLGRASNVWADPAQRNTTAPMNILFNHHKLTLYYESRRTARGLRIVGAVVQPWSIRHTKSFIDSKNPHDFPLTCWEVSRARQQGCTAVAVRGC